MLLVLSIKICAYMWDVVKRICICKTNYSGMTLIEEKVDKYAFTQQT
jgi:hypothetical protein